MAIDFEAISLEFAARGWQWKLTSGEVVVPSTEDIKIAVDGLQQTLANSEELQSQITMGRLIMQRNHDNYDLYVWAGGLNAQESN